MLSHYLGCQIFVRWHSELTLPHWGHRDIRVALQGHVKALLVSTGPQHTIVRKTPWASLARPPEPSARMSAFSRAVSGFRPLALTSCMMQHGVNGMLGAHMPDTAAEAMLGTGVRTGRVRPHEQINGLHQGDTRSGQGWHLMHSERGWGVASLGTEAQ